MDWRFLKDPPLDGAANMARDEALLRSAASGSSPALRLYAWARPTLSLGAHQPISDVRPEECRARRIDLVRRPTGGGAVLHDLEVTYAVAGRVGEPPFPRAVGGLYERVAAALVHGLSRLGVASESRRQALRGRAPADCFRAASSREIVASGRKLVGSAQLRRGGAFVQHGSLLLGLDAERLAAVVPGAGPEAPVPASSPAGRHPAAITLVELLGPGISREEVEDAVAAGFEAVFEARLVPSEWRAEEAELAARLRAFKYLDASWTLDGRSRSRIPGT